jgi:hypothetical protein
LDTQLGPTYPCCYVYPTLPRSCFFAAPPAEIGKIQSIGSTLTRGKRPRPAILKISVSAIAFLPFIFIVSFGPTFGSTLPILYLLFYFVVSLFFATIIFVGLSFSHTCSFVGDQGVADYTITGSRTLAVTENILLFKDVTTFYVSERQQVGSPDKSISCIFNRGQDQPYSISGYNQSKKKQQASNDLWYFARAAEQAWIAHYTHYAGQQLGELGYIEFAMTGNPKAVRVGKGYLEFIAKDDSTAYMAASDIKEIALNNGIFYFAHKDRKWWQGQSQCCVAYARLSNARTFLMCLNQLVGVVVN